MDLVLDRTAAGAGVANAMTNLDLAGNTLNVLAGPLVTSGRASVIFSAPSYVGPGATINTVSADVVMENVVGGDGGSLTKTGAGLLTLRAANTYSGSTTVSAGTLQVGLNGVGSTGTGPTLLSGPTGVLAGTGLVQGGTTVSSGLVRPGDSAGAATGTLTFAESLAYTGGSTEFQISGGTDTGLDRDEIIVTGSLTLDANSPIQVVFNGFVPLADTTYTWDLFDWVGILINNGFSAGTTERTGQNSAGNEGNLDLPDISSIAGSVWDTSQFLTNGSISIVALVPEPSRAVLIMAGLALGLLRRRRRK